MAAIRVHPSALEGDTPEETKKAEDFFISVGLLQAGDHFVADESAPRYDAEDDSDIDIPETASSCKEACKAAYKVAKAACNLSGNYKKCRKKAKAAYKRCVAVCDLAEG